MILIGTKPEKVTTESYLVKEHHHIEFDYLKIDDSENLEVVTFNFYVHGKWIPIHLREIEEIRIIETDPTRTHLEMYLYGRIEAYRQQYEKLKECPYCRMKKHPMKFHGDSDMCEDCYDYRVKRLKSTKEMVDDDPNYQKEPEPDVYCEKESEWVHKEDCKFCDYYDGRCAYIDSNGGNEQK